MCEFTMTEFGNISLSAGLWFSQTFGDDGLVSYQELIDEMRLQMDSLQAAEVNDQNEHLLASLFDWIQIVQANQCTQEFQMHNFFNEWM